MSQDDPFGINSDRTVIRPNPGGRNPAVSTPERPSIVSPAGLAAADIVPLTTGDATNPLVALALPLLALSQRLRNTPMQRDVPALRQRIVEQLDNFERAAANTETPSKAVTAAHYALCVTIDDVINSTPWGLTSEWARASMAGSFHNDMTGGERFFEILRHFEREPANYGNLLELMYLCLSLAFEGRMRVSAAGASELTRTRENLYALLRQRRGEFERDLSPHWRGVAAAHRPLGAAIPLWVIGAATAAILLIVFFVFSYLLGLSSDNAYAQLGALPPNGGVAIRVQAPPPPIVVQNPTLQHARTFLAPEIREGLVSLSENAQTAHIRLHAGNMFAPGSAAFGEKLGALLRRVGEELNTVPGKIQIVGHTDSTPIHTLRFPSNYDLSFARAKAVRDYLKPILKTDNRMTILGRADTDPLEPNTTPAGRAANRRIDIILTKPGATN